MVTGRRTLMITESSAQLVRLLHLASPLLPVGAYSYSQGLETAIANGWANDEGGTCAWISDLLSHVVGRVEAPVFLRLWHAAKERDADAYAQWNAWFIASREARELRAEGERMGQARAALG